MAIIKKGAYRFNDDLTIPTLDLSLKYGLPFIVKPNFINTNGDIIIVNGHFVCDGMYFEVNSTFPKGVLVYNITNGQTNGTQPVYSFDTDVKWNYLYEVLDAFGSGDYTQLKCWGQTIIVTEDTEFTDMDGAVFGGWFNEHTTPVAINIITYNGKIIATTEKGQTVTLSCKDKVMKDDIVITL